MNRNSSQELSPSQERSQTDRPELRLLVEAVQDYAIFLLDPEGNISSWNSGASRIFGFQEQEVLGRHFSIFYGPDDIAARKPRRELQTAAAAGRVEDEGWRLRKDGSRFWTDTIITVMRNEAGEIAGFAKITRDVTEQRQTEEEIRQSMETFQLLVSSVQDYAIFMLDPEGLVATWNSGAERIKGYKPEEIIGRHFSAFYGEQDILDRKPERKLEIARKQGKVEDEGWRLRKDGTRFWANVVITAVHDEHGQLRGFAKITRDVTERKQAEETRHDLLEQREARIREEEKRRYAEASYQIAEEANRAKDEFLMTLSHELRTPMTAILGWARMLPALSPDDPLFHEAIESIASAARLQARLIDDILDVSRIMSGKLLLNPELVDMAGVILNAVDTINPTAAAKEIAITTSFAPGLGSLTVDATRIQQVIWNLLSNAVKFTPSKGSVHVSAERQASSVEISVRDTGEGIDPDFLPHLFEPFRQAEDPQTRMHGGLGLGLSIVRSIAEAHGGTVTARSEGSGKGATFTVTLPVHGAGAVTGESKGLGGTHLSQDRLRGLEIVLVEDDGGSRKMFTTVLRAAGAEVVAHDSALAALDAIDRKPPDLVITDIAMPEIDGYTFVRSLRARSYGPNLRIVALTAFPAGKEERNGFDAYLLKPIDPFHLVDELARIAAEPDSTPGRSTIDALPGR
ncbi:MAG TPA: PAS domain S-box protein [Thermoanaerobaculia bacterium]|nr:PAS domain S-box protein [Thermoanaerobaculia bacterium]